MLQSIVDAFFPGKVVAEIKPYGKGHINNTYKVALKDIDETWILQQINADVFHQPHEMAKTHIQLQRVFDESAAPISIARLIPTHQGENLFTDPRGGVWRMTTFIPKSYSIDVITEDWQAWEAGNAFGWFAKVCSPLNHKDFSDPIKDFHRLSYRLQQLHDAIEHDKANRLRSIEDFVKFYLERADKLLTIDNLADEGKIPIRIVHNDTKINNLLFREKSAVAIIDLDTTGPGLLYYDYGDAIRTGANTAEEDERDPVRVGFNLNAFKAFTRGYIARVKPILTPREAEHLCLAPILMTYIMGIRFLADFLNGDCYYKINFPDHNLIRSIVQKTLIECMEKKTTEMKSIIHSALNFQSSS
jgi:hypothetical protein